MPLHLTKRPKRRPTNPAMARPWLAALLLMVVAACDPEARVREQLAGEYLREVTTGTVAKTTPRQVLLLRADGTWLRTTQMEPERQRRGWAPDSGTYRVQGVIAQHEIAGAAWPAVPLYDRRRFAIQRRRQHDAHDHGL